MNLGKVKEITSDWVKALIWGKSDVRTAEHCLPFGIDSKPVLGKIAVYSKTENNGRAIILGYVYASTETQNGELRLFATDSEGIEKSDVYFKNDGTCEFMGNDDWFVRFSELEKNFNNLLRTVNQNAEAYNTHTHPYLIPPSTSPLNTTATITQQSISTADISLAKIVKIRTYKSENIS